ncbi:MAG: glycosyltransferase [Hyphomicrobiaceae bacterium]|nr:glycosyltransferase [Hyphomicrobiaceae bacterium]
MHCVHTISSLDANAAGPSYVVPRLCRALAKLGTSVELYSLGPTASHHVDGYIDRRFQPDLDWAPFLDKLGMSHAMCRALKCSKASVLHAHGLWRLPSIYAARAARESNRPLVLSPHGMLGAEALKFSSLQKKLFWQTVQGAGLRDVSCFHATSAAECDAIRALGLKQPIAMIPYGIDIPRPTTDESGPQIHTVISLGRVHPLKGLDQLIRAWATLELDYPKWRLLIVGPSEKGHGEELTRLCQDLGLSHVEISGPRYGESKWRLLAQADVFALSTRADSFAVSVAESLACGTPVIATKGAPWAGLATHRCGWWIDHGREAMAAALRDAMSLSPEDRGAMGARGRAWMERDFSWDGIARKMMQLYRWLRDCGEKPPFIEGGFRAPHKKN